MRMIIRRELRTGIDLYDIVEAHCGTAALAAIRAGGVDLVLSDWNMPEMSGIELLESLRRERWTGPLGFITSESGRATRIRAYQAGASFVVTKPFTGDSLSRQVTHALGWNSVATETRTTDEDGPTVASVLRGLLRRPVWTVPSAPPRREVARAVARYVDADGYPVAAAVSEISLAAASGAALSLTPAVDATEWAAAGVLTEALAQNFYEVANVLANVANPGGVRCTLAEITVLADFERPPDHQRLVAAPTQLNLEVTVEGYGSGRIALISLEGAVQPQPAQPSLVAR
jgi:two-component system, chemotaxis family, chemotaxis protein CheY